MSLRMMVILALTGILITHWFSRGELQGSDDKSAAAKTVDTDAVDTDGAEPEQPESEADAELTATGEDPDSDAQESGEDKKNSEPVTVLEEEEDQGVAKGSDRLAAVTVFVLAIFVGFEVITKVPPTLHTPLMSGSNAVSGITVVGAIVVAGQQGWFSSWLGMVAVALAMVNVVGGFLVTHRMLAMFKKR